MTIRRPRRSVSQRRPSPSTLACVVTGGTADLPYKQTAHVVVVRGDLRDGTETPLLGFPALGVVVKGNRIRKRLFVGIVLSRGAK